MSVAIIQKSPIAGLLMPPPSKSAGHRALICAALAALQNRGEGVCYRVSRLLDPSGSALSDDLAATLRAIRAMGVNATADADALILTAGSRPSGFSYRFSRPWGFRLVSRGADGCRIVPSGCMPTVCPPTAFRSPFPPRAAACLSICPDTLPAVLFSFRAISPVSLSAACSWPFPFVMRTAPSACPPLWNQRIM